MFFDSILIRAILPWPTLLWSQLSAPWTSKWVIRSTGGDPTPESRRREPPGIMKWPSSTKEAAVSADFRCKFSPGAGRSAGRSASVGALGGPGYA